MIQIRILQQKLLLAKIDTNQLHTKRVSRTQSLTSTGQVLFMPKYVNNSAKKSVSYLNHPSFRHLIPKIILCNSHSTHILYPKGGPK